MKIINRTKLMISRLLSLRVFAFFWFRVWSAASRLPIPAIRAEVGKAKSSVGYLFTDVETWKLQSVYEKLSSEGGTHILISVRFGHNGCFPSAKCGHARAALQGKARSIRWFSIIDHVFIHNLDTLIFSHPYAFVGGNFSLATLRRTFRIYVPYSIGIVGNGSEYTYGRRAIEAADVITVFSDSLSKEVFSAQNLHSKKLIIGYPGLSRVKAREESAPRGKSLNILFAPHWSALESPNYTVSLDALIVGLESLRLEMLAKSVKLNIRIRVHPRFKDYLGNPPNRLSSISMRIIAEWQTIRKGQSYEADFNWSDLLIHNSGSFTLEYLASKKPAIFYLDSSDIPENLNRLGLEALSCHYQSPNAFDVSEIIRGLVKDLDPMHDARHEFFARQIQPNLMFDKKIASIVRGNLRLSSGRT